MADTGIVLRRDLKQNLENNPPRNGELIYATDSGEHGWSNVKDNGKLVWKDLTSVIESHPTENSLSFLPEDVVKKNGATSKIYCSQIYAGLNPDSKILDSYATEDKIFVTTALKKEVSGNIHDIIYHECTLKIFDMHSKDSKFIMFGSDAKDSDGNLSFDYQDAFGCSVNVYNNLLYISAPYSVVNNIPGVGCIYVFDLDGNYIKRLNSPIIDKYLTYAYDFIVFDDKIYAYTKLLNDNNEIIESIIVTDLDGILLLNYFNDSVHGSASISRGESRKFYIMDIDTFDESNRGVILYDTTHMIDTYQLKEEGEFDKVCSIITPDNTVTPFEMPAIQNLAGEDQTAGIFVCKFGPNNTYVMLNPVYDSKDKILSNETFGDVIKAGSGNVSSVVIVDENLNIEIKELLNPDGPYHFGKDIYRYDDKYFICPYNNNDDDPKPILNFNIYTKEQTADPDTLVYNDKINFKYDNPIYTHFGVSENKDTIMAYKIQTKYEGPIIDRYSNDFFPFLLGIDFEPNHETIIYDYNMETWSNNTGIPYKYVPDDSGSGSGSGS